MDVECDVTSLPPLSFNRHPRGWSLEAAVPAWAAQEPGAQTRACHRVWSHGETEESSEHITGHIVSVCILSDYKGDVHRRKYYKKQKREEESPVNPSPRYNHCSRLSVFVNFLIVFKESIV